MMDNKNDTVMDIDRSKELFEYEMTEVMRLFRKEADRLLNGIAENAPDVEIPAASLEYTSAEVKLTAPKMAVFDKEVMMELALRTPIKPEMDVEGHGDVKQVGLTSSVGEISVDRAAFQKAAADVPAVSIDFSPAEAKTSFPDGSIFEPAVPKNISALTECSEAIRSFSLNAEDFRGAVIPAFDESFAGNDRSVTVNRASFSGGGRIPTINRKFADADRSVTFDKAAFADAEPKAPHMDKSFAKTDRSVSLDKAAFAKAEPKAPAVDKSFAMADRSVTVSSAAFAEAAVSVPDVKISSETEIKAHADKGAFESIGLTVPNAPKIELKEHEAVKLSAVKFPDVPEKPDLSGAFAEILDSVRKEL